MDGMDDDEAPLVLDPSIEENVKSKSGDDEEDYDGLDSENNKTVMTKKIDEISS